MHHSTITSKGQTTIPVEIRNFLHLHSGDRVEYIVQEEGKVLLVPSNISLNELRAVLPPPKKHVSLADMDQAIRTRGAGKPS